MVAIPSDVCVVVVGEALAEDKMLDGAMELDKSVSDDQVGVFASGTLLEVEIIDVVEIVLMAGVAGVSEVAVGAEGFSTAVVVPTTEGYEVVCDTVSDGPAYVGSCDE